MKRQIVEGADKPMVEWSAERIAQLSNIAEIKALRGNAVKRGNTAVANLCDAELTRRMPPRIKPPKSDSLKEARAGQYVAEFHFVCPNESEVKKEQSGLIRTGTWVVAEANAKKAEKYGSLIALHVTKAEPSYLQGRIRAWKKQERQPRNADGELVSNDVGIEFEFEPTDDPLSWKGDGTGEKGYLWSPIPE